MQIDKYVPSLKSCPAHRALHDSVAAITPQVTATEILLKRIDGAFSNLCDDAFYVAHDDGKLLSRCWMGWGKHNDSIGNWGYFFTAPECRGRGIGGAVLNLWRDDFNRRTSLPLCFLCTTGSANITKYYAKFGFRTVIEGSEFGPLYMPVGDSPATFSEFCEGYYQPSGKLYRAKATMEFRHEIDCLLRFYFIQNGLDFPIDDINGVDAAIHCMPESTFMLFSEDGHCVGWGVNDEYRVHPLYKNIEIDPSN
jgi:GNAT superfamily N-acetyltransferase